MELYVVNRHFNNRAVSQIIAALLLIAITVTAAVLLYVFSIGLLGSLGTGGAQNIKEQLVMEGYNFPTTGPLTLTVRNVGPSLSQHRKVLISSLTVLASPAHSDRRHVSALTAYANPVMRSQCSSHWFAVFQSYLWCGVSVEDRYA